MSELIYYCDINLLKVRIFDCEGHPMFVSNFENISLKDAEAKAIDFGGILEVVK